MSMKGMCTEVLFSFVGKTMDHKGRKTHQSGIIGIVILVLRDLVNTDIFLQNLEIYHLYDNSLCWLLSYHQGRHQCLKERCQKQD